MKTTFTLVLLMVSLTLTSTSQPYSYELMMDNFEQISESEIQWDIFLRKGSTSDNWALYSMQLRWQFDNDIYNTGGAFETGSLTIDDTETDLITNSGWFTDAHFTKINPSGTEDLIQWAVITAPSPGLPVTVFDDFEWKKVARFSAVLMKGVSPHNFKDLDPLFAFQSSGLQLIVRRCGYTGSNPTATMDGTANYEIDPATRVVIPPPGVKINDRQLAGYCFTGDGDWDDNARWNNVTAENANTPPGLNSNAIINGNVTITGDESLLPLNGNGGELTINTGVEPLYTLTATGNFIFTNAGIMYIWSGAPFSSTDLGNPADLASGTNVTLQAIDYSGQPATVQWTTIPPNSGVFGNPNATVTTFTMPALDVEVIATFSPSDGKTSNAKVDLDIESYPQIGEELLKSFSNTNTLFASLTIATGGTLTVDKLFNDNENGAAAIVLKSAAGEVSGSLMHNNTGVEATVERYLEQNQWHFVSSPISNGVSGIFLDVYLKDWDETTGAWDYIIPTNEPLPIMKGFEAWSSVNFGSPDMVYYAGELNVGPHSIDLTNTSTAPALNRGYNFIGNPYPCAVNWSLAAGWVKSSITGTIYIYNPAVGQYGSFPPEEPEFPANGVSQYIHSGQGFFVQVPDNSSTGSVSVKNEARLHNAQAFLKKGNKELDGKLLKLKTSSDINTYSDESIIMFKQDATASYDMQYDAYKLDGIEDAPKMYTTNIDQDHLLINSLTEDDENIIVPVNFEVGIGGIYTIEVNESVNFAESTDIILEDKKDGVFTNLTEQSTYSFTADPSDDAERFNVYFYFNPSTEIETMALSNLHIFTSQHKLILESLSNDFLSGQLHVYTLLGQQVVGEKVDAGLKHETEIQEEGIYIVTFYNQQDQKQYRQKIQIR